MINIERLKLQLNNQEYFTDTELEVFLDESGLNPFDVYTQEMKLPLLETVLAILEALSNNLDLFRTVETEFATSGEAFNALSKRIIQVKNQINGLESNTEKTSQFSCMYFGGGNV